jgi:hypothetical protein
MNPMKLYVFYFSIIPLKKCCFFSIDSLKKEEKSSSAVINVEAPLLTPEQIKVNKTKLIFH